MNLNELERLERESRVPMCDICGKPVTECIGTEPSHPGRFNWRLKQADWFVAISAAAPELIAAARERDELRARVAELEREFRESSAQSERFRQAAVRADEQKRIAERLALDLETKLDHVLNGMNPEDACQAMRAAEAASSNEVDA